MFFLFIVQVLSPFFGMKSETLHFFYSKRVGQLTISVFMFPFLGVGPGVTGEGEGLHGVSLPRTLSAVCPLYIINI